LKDLREKTTVAELCRKEGINQNTYYRWSKDFTPADKKRFKSDTEREAITNEVQGLRKENSNLKHLVAVLSLKNN
jgi:transposase